MVTVYSQMKRATDTNPKSPTTNRTVATSSTPDSTERVKSNSKAVTTTRESSKTEGDQDTESRNS